MGVCLCVWKCVCALCKEWKKQIRQSQITFTKNLRLAIKAVAEVEEMASLLYLGLNASTAN